MPSDLLPFGSVKKCPKCGAGKSKIKTSYCDGDPCAHQDATWGGDEHLAVWCDVCKWPANTKCADAKGGPHAK